MEDFKKDLEGFTKDLIALFEKHNLKVLQDTTELSFSPIEMHIHKDYAYSTRDISIKFTEFILDEDKAKEYAEKYGYRFAIYSR